MNHAGRVIAVTGGSRGIGRAIVQRLAVEGAHIVFTYATAADPAARTLEAIKAAGGSAEVHPLEVADFDATQAFFKGIAARHGRIDGLVNNAGLTKDNLLLRMKEEQWDRVLDVNLKGVFHCTRAAARSMVKKRHGRIVNITSVVAVTGNAGQSNYAASKAGIIGFTRSIAVELASRSITVNAVAPGFIDTDMTQSLPERVREELLQRVPLGRLGKAEEVAALVSFLLSDDADYITGQVIHVNGGIC
ncbi:MAG: 3-oxoacyl-[acyl-carrier-protein] reductase [Deltaproteobacteria bacterium RBG_13_65_10]|nr:MAG: 3-oxoacyl-[acyl-carrier-protein] reductase [Deltaproteobacteria bacterium RBG_13_65_10]